MQCPKCGASTYEHWYRDKGVYEYSGPSEIRCTSCDYRIGYFCKQKLTGDEVEPIECLGCQYHPRIIDI